MNAAPSAGEMRCTLAEARRIEPGAMTERRPDDRVVVGRHVLEHVELIGHQRHASFDATDQTDRLSDAIVSPPARVASSSSRQASFSHSSDA